MKNENPIILTELDNHFHFLTEDGWTYTEFPSLEQVKAALLEPVNPKTSKIHSEVQKHIYRSGESQDEMALRLYHLLRNKNFIEGKHISIDNRLDFLCAWTFYVCMVCNELLRTKKASKWNLIDQMANLKMLYSKWKSLINTKWGNINGGRIANKKYLHERQAFSGYFRENAPLSRSNRQVMRNFCSEQVKQRLKLDPEFCFEKHEPTLKRWVKSMNQEWIVGQKSTAPTISQN